MKRNGLLLALLFSVAVFFTGTAGEVGAQGESFYKGKTIAIIELAQRGF
jgi:hypothetical protein